MILRALVASFGLSCMGCYFLFLGLSTFLPFGTALNITGASFSFLGVLITLANNIAYNIAIAKGADSQSAADP
jgi:hypothetical protein